MGRLTGLAAKKVRINLLYDFYGQLLTEKQQELIGLYYQADLSLGEIAEQQKVSRQAVYDILKRSERTLEDFESKLHLVEKHRRDRIALEEVGRALQETADKLQKMTPEDDEGGPLAGLARRLVAAAERLKTLD